MTAVHGSAVLSLSVSLMQGWIFAALAFANLWHSLSFRIYHNPYRNHKRNMDPTNFSNTLTCLDPRLFLDVEPEGEAVLMGGAALAPASATSTPDPASTVVRSASATALLTSTLLSSSW